MNLPKVQELDKKLIVKVIAGFLLLAVAFAFYLTKEKNPEPEDGISLEMGEDEEARPVTTNDSIEEQVMIMVDVEGAVKQPGVVALPEGGRVFQAIEKAGGFSSEADSRVINQAEILSDGQKLYIPTKKEVLDSSAANSSGDVLSEGSGQNTQNPSSFCYGGPAATASAKININTADSGSLQNLPGVGPSTADKIIAYRNENGKFKKIDDIKNVSGIGEKTFEKFKDQITI